MIELHNGLVGPWDEARYLRQLTDPHVLPIRNALEDLGQPILVTEIAEGGTVADYLSPGGGVPPVQAIDWTRQACLGVARAHAEGLIHNDIKPGNLFLTKTGRCMVGDFGFATIVDPVLGAARLYGTTPTTGAPEAITGALTGTSTATAASDVYSLGATLYWILAGGPPVPETLTHQQARDYVVAGKVVPLKSAAPNIGDYVCRVVAAAMSTNPTTRQQSANELHAALGSARSSESNQRQWTAVSQHPGHDGCWQCPPEGGKKGLSLCVIPRPTSGFEILVTFCGSARKYRSVTTTSSGRNANLRRVFKGI
jgi:serine/threonine-protein kinase